jgi:hypothetical protein
MDLAPSLNYTYGKAKGTTGRFYSVYQNTKLYQTKVGAIALHHSQTKELLLRLD